MNRILSVAGLLAVAIAVFPHIAWAQTQPAILEQSGAPGCTLYTNDALYAAICSMAVTNPPTSGALPAVVSVSNSQYYNGTSAGTPVTATISGSTSGSFSETTSNLLFYSCFGQPPNDTFVYSGYTSGGQVSITNSADITWDGIAASNLGIEFEQLNNDTQYEYLALGGGALVGLSAGGNGYADNISDPDPDNFDAGDGGPVIISHTGSLIVSNDGTSTTFTNTSGPQIPLSMNAIAALSFGGNGANNKTGNTDYAGTGGAGGTITLQSDGPVSVSSTSTDFPVIGLLGLSQGGIGSNQKNYAFAPGGDGGQVTVSGSSSVSVEGANAYGAFAASFGGASDFDNKHDGNDASGAGNGGPVSIDLQSGASIAFTEQGVGIGAMALSAGGDADNGWEGTGGTATVTVDSGASVDTSGAAGSLSIGVLAVSAGSVGDILPFDSGSVNDAYPGTPGDATATNSGTVTTAGALSVGVAAMSIGGAAILTNGSDSDSSTLGNVASDYSSFSGATATVTNNSSITTTGASAFGVLAQSIGGGGGLLNLEEDAQSAYLGSSTTDTDTSGDGAAATVTHSGSILTGNGSGGGDAAIGIVAQSIGGGGGSSNAPAFFAGGNDGSGSGGGDGGPVTVTTNDSSTIATYDLGAMGILAQSVGGGGGNGANGEGIYVAVGGAGGNGGDGDTVTIDLDNGGQGSIVTAADFAGGAFAQSIGGGGGNGGYSTAVSVADSVAIGGTGGSGGTGGTVSLTNDSVIVTAGNQALGGVAQSVGGGGGNGGSANTYDAGLLTIGISVGGAGGDGGDGGEPTVTNNSQIYTGCQDSTSSCTYAIAGGQTLVGANSVGMVAQSIGGGGGSGGSATSSSFSLGTDEVPVTISFDFAVGGSGGSGGDGETVTATNSGTLVTGGDSAHGILAQAIGGGGGTGGDATASSYAISSGVPTLQFALAIGGGGGTAGDGGTVNVTLGESDTCSGCNGQVTTYGLDAVGVLAQSIGGGGGTGGTGDASASSPNLGGTTGTSIDVTFGVGGSGGSGNDGEAVTVTVDAGSGVTTTGSGGKAILAQSIGGGGGNASGGQASASNDNFVGNFVIGGSGGSSGDGGAVTVSNAGSIQTGGLYTNSANLSVVTGGDGVGILAHSIGGGGGTGGNSDPEANLNVVGQVEDALNSPSNSYQANIGVGGTGGAGGDGNTVTLDNSGPIQTVGVRAYGIHSQSIGGGGGSGGAATSTSNSVIGGTSGTNTAGTYAADVSVGGQGGGAGDGGGIDIDNTDSIQTAGYGAHAILAQSIGGGGGVGAEGTVDNTTTVGIGGGISGDGGTSGDGDTIEITDSGTLWTAGDDAYAILAQSIGAGGGAAGVGCSNSAQVGPQGNSASLCLGNSQVGVTTSTSVWNDSSDFTFTVGGTASSSGNGGGVTIDKSSGSVTTTGARASAIVAQSIGGGGGLVPASYVNVTEVTLNAGATTGAGSSVSVTLDSGVSVSTYGNGAMGLLAQSVGAGGGFGGDMSLDLSTTQVNEAIYDSANTSNGGTITVTTSADIATSGSNAHGLFLQSLTTGGLVGVNGELNAGNLLDDIETSGTAGSITVDQQGGSIVASGAGSVGIFAQSSGNASEQNPITITISGQVEGGSGASAVGVWISGGLSDGGTSQTSGVSTNTITINSGGSISTAEGIDAWAIQAEQSITNVSNAGTLTGDIDLGQASYSNSTVLGNLTNTGLFNSGSQVTAASLTNNGTLAVGGTGTIVTTALSGPFTQNSGGIFDVDIDALADPQVDLLSVNASAGIDGSIEPTATNLLPGSYTVANATSMTASATVPASYLFTWSVQVTSTDLSITPNADFTPSGADLTAAQQTQAKELQSAWDAGGSDDLAPVFASLMQVQSASDYQSALDELAAN